MIRLRYLALVLFCMLLAPLASGQPRLKEKFREFVACGANGGPCGVLYLGTVQCTLFADFSASDDFPLFNESTIFRFEIGNLAFEAPLGADPDYQVGDTEVTFVSGEMVASGNPIVLRLKLSWKDGKVRLRLKARTPYIDSPAAASRSNGAIFSTHLSSTISFRNGSTHLMSASGGADYPSQHKTKSKTVEGTTYELETIKVQGPAS